MPRKRKQTKQPKEKKVKNIIQQVIVKLDSEGKRITRRKKRTAPKRQMEKKEEVNVMATIPANVIYQTGAYPSAPPAFAPVAQPVPFSVPVKKTFTEEIVEPVKKEEKKEVQFVPLVDKKQKEESVIGIGFDELPTTASFADPSVVEKITTPEKLYTYEPPSFKSDVEGNIRFGMRPDYMETLTQSDITTPLYEREKKQQKDLHSIDYMSAKKVRELYSDKFGVGSWKNPETGKAIPVSVLRKKLKEEYNL